MAVEHVSTIIDRLLQNILVQGKANLMDLFERHLGNLEGMAKEAEITVQQVKESLEFHGIPIRPQ